MKRSASELLAEILLEGHRADVLQKARDCPAFDGLCDQSDDELAAEHHRVFGYGYPPFAGIYLADPALAGHGEPSDAAHALAQAHNVAHDHLGIALLTDPASLAAWLPRYHAALSFEKTSLFTEVVAMVLDLHPSARCAGGEVLDLDDSATSRRDIANYLATPKRCGLYYSLPTLTRVGLYCEVPQGFGSRVTRIENLFASAAQLELIPQLTEALDLEAARQGLREDAPVRRVLRIITERHLAF